MARARRVALFWPLVDRHEPVLRPLDAALRAQGKQLYYPTMTPPHSFTETVSSASLSPNRHGFFEPSPGAPLAPNASLDVIVAPALALCLDGTRLGYGAGYYDRAIGAQRPPALVIGVCFQGELLAELPRATHDEAVDWIVTDELSQAREPPR
jgi:5-formyltetrahydrofolate cyclo-ligase